jgi:hypothetical protein
MGVCVRKRFVLTLFYASRILICGSSPSTGMSLGQFAMRNTAENVNERTGFHRVIPSPAFLALPATNRSAQVLEPDTFTVVPEIRECAPPKWNDWRPTHRPEYNPDVDAPILLVPSTRSSSNLYPRTWDASSPSCGAKLSPSTPVRFSQEVLVQGAMLSVGAAARKGIYRPVRSY